MMGYKMATAVRLVMSISFTVGAVLLWRWKDDFVRARTWFIIILFMIGTMCLVWRAFDVRTKYNPRWTLDEE